MFDDKSLICQFDLEYFYGLTNHLIDFSETLFEFLNFKIKKIFVSSDRKVSAPSYKKFKSFINPDYFSSISFQSDYNKADFEPQTHLYTNINNFLKKGSEYVLPKPITKFTVIFNDMELLKNSEKIYKEILSELSKISGINVTGYSFLLPNTYGAVSFSSGVLRKMNMSQSLQDGIGIQVWRKVSLDCIIALIMRQESRSFF